MKKLAIETLNSSSNVNRTNDKLAITAAKYRWTSMVAGALFWIGSTGSQVLAVATHTSSFTSADQSWVGTNSDSQFSPGGAVDNGGYLGVFRNGADPLASANSTTHDNTNLSGAFIGDLLARYGGGLGNQMEISLYHKDFSLSPASNINLALSFSSGANDTFLINPPNPALDPKLSSAEWRQLKLTIDLDSASPPAGWVHTGSGSMTWAQVMQTATLFRIQTWNMENNNQQLGLDEITFASVPVPEPSGALLFASGLLVVAMRRGCGGRFAR